MPSRGVGETSGKRTGTQDDVFQAEQNLEATGSATKNKNIELPAHRVGLDGQSNSKEGGAITSSRPLTSAEKLKILKQTESSCSDSGEDDEGWEIARRRKGKEKDVSKPKKPSRGGHG